MYSSQRVLNTSPHCILVSESARTTQYSQALGETTSYLHKEETEQDQLLQKEKVPHGQQVSPCNQHRAFCLLYPCCATAERPCPLLPEDGYNNRVGKVPYEAQASGKFKRAFFEAETGKDIPTLGNSPRIGYVDYLFISWQGSVPSPRPTRTWLNGDGMTENVKSPFPTISPLLDYMSTQICKNSKQ